MGQFAAFLPGIGSALGGLLGGDGGVGDANARNSQLNQQIQNLFKELGQREALNFREAKGLFQGRADRVLGDIDRAAAGIGSTERSLKRGASDRAQQSTAGLTSNLQQSGFNSSTIGANLQRGINSDLERNLAGISGQADRARSGIASTKAGFRSQVEGDLANLPLLRNSASSNRIQGLVAALQEMASVPGGQTGGFGELGGSLGGLLGSFFSGGGGGGSLGSSFNLNLDGLNGTFA